MSSSSAHVTVSPQSQVIVFSGNLLKAPPLNRRGRKKWHERYFLLRANKTIEIHKSRKAAEAQKTPRRVIDLRECISLELGLEYKNLQHILSLGTFKRTFFLAAPSNALMLQWGNVLEKVKSAVSGQEIEVLDIGLRNTRKGDAVHRVKPAEPIQPFSSTPTSPKRVWGKLYQKGASKSTIAISSVGKDKQNGGFVNRGSGNVGYTSYYTSPNRSSSLSNQELYRHQEHASLSALHERLAQMYGYPQMIDNGIEAVDLHGRGRLSSASASTPSSHTSSSGLSPLHPPFVGGKIPPPHMMLKGWGSPLNEGSLNHSPGEGDGFYNEEDIQRDDRWRRINSKDYGRREGMLHRSEAFRSPISRAGSATTGDVSKGQGTNEEGGTRGMQNGSISSSTPLKQSTHYRKIELQAEKPLFMSRQDDDGDSSDEEVNSVVSEATGKNSPGMVPLYLMGGKLGRDPYRQSPLSIPERFERHGRRRNYSGPPVSGRRSGGYGHPSARSRERLEMRGRGYMGGSDENGWIGGASGQGNMSPFGDVIGQNSPRRPHFLSRQPLTTTDEIASQRFYSLESLERGLQEERANSYCRVTVGPRDERAALGITSRRAGISDAKLDSILSKSSVNSTDNDIQLPSPNPGSICGEELHTHQSTSYSSDNFDACIQLSPPSPLFEEEDLPNGASESYLYHSLDGIKSPVEEIIAPPLTFNNVHTTPNCIANDTISEEVEPPICDSDQVGHNSKATADRHSAESGYTSGQGQSPGISDKRNLTTVDEDTPVSAAMGVANGFPTQHPKIRSNSPVNEVLDTLSELSISSVRNSVSSIQYGSQTSYASTDSIRLYVPFVFQKRGGKASRKDLSKRSLFVTVCLVENSDTVIKELLRQKLLGGYSVVECEGEVGKSVVSACDDFTVETGLEDLEFGFSITTSTQKDVYINRAKVREFQFQIDNLFGCSKKPFSCDVEIRHADQITVLPIEIESDE